MNLPKIGQSIIVRCNNGYMDTKHLNKIYEVVRTSDSHNAYDAGSTESSSYKPVVWFRPEDSGTDLYTSEWDIVPAIGDKVRAVRNGLSDYNGHECVITHIYPGTTAYTLTGEFKSIQKPDDTISLSFSEWEPIDEPAAPVEDPEITRFKAQVETLLRKVADWEQDWVTMTDALHKEADRRGWCNEYDEFVNEIESDLRIGTMPRRERDYEVTWTTTVLVSVEVSRNYTAASPEEAKQMAKDDYYAGPETQDILNAVHNMDWEESDDSYREYEVEEV